MPLTPVHVERFGGLNLRDDPAEVGLAGAADLLNVEFRPGVVRSRGGFSNFTTTEGTNRYDSLCALVGAAGGVIAGAGNRLEALNSAGVVTDSSTAPTAHPHYFTRFGTPTGNSVYIANGTDRIRKYDATGGFTSPVGLATQTGRFVAVQTPDNRLVYARTSTNGSRVAFSNAGDAETFSANDYVDITPGDGEDITALVAWRNLLFAFKPSSYVVFYGNSADSTGNAVFNYRSVRSGTGATALGGACAGPDGVYFQGLNGIYRTTGGDPQLISGPITPFFTGVGAPATYTGPSSYPQYGNALAALTWMNDSLYAHVSTTADSYVLVWNAPTDTWSIWDLPATAFEVVRDSTLGHYQLWFTRGSGLKHICSMVPVNTSDAGTAIVSRYRSGFGDLGYPGQEKTIRETELVGQGTPTFGWSRDFGSVTTTSSQAITLGTAPAAARRLHRKSQDGELFSWQASATSGAWQLNSITPFVRDVRGPAETTS